VITGPDRPYTVVQFQRRLAVDGEIEVLTVLVQVHGRCRILFVVHDADQHVVNIGELLINEENTFAAWHYHDGSRQSSLRDHRHRRLLRGH